MGRHAAPVGAAEPGGQRTGARHRGGQLSAHQQVAVEGAEAADHGAKCDEAAGTATDEHPDEIGDRRGRGRERRLRQHQRHGAARQQGDDACDRGARQRRARHIAHRIVDGIRRHGSALEAEQREHRDAHRRERGGSLQGDRVDRCERCASLGGHQPGRQPDHEDERQQFDQRRDDLDAACQRPRVAEREQGDEKERDGLRPERPCVDLRNQPLQVAHSGHRDRRVGGPHAREVAPGGEERGRIAEGRPYHAMRAARLRQLHRELREDPRQAHGARDRDEPSEHGVPSIGSERRRQHEDAGADDVADHQRDRRDRTQPAASKRAHRAVSAATLSQARTRQAPASAAVGTVPGANPAGITAGSSVTCSHRSATGA